MRSIQSLFWIRVQDALRDRKESGREKVRDQDLADATGNTSKSWAGNMRALRREITLNDAAAIAERLEMPLSELVRRPDDVTYELTGLEARVIEAYRTLQPSEREALLTLATLRYRKVGRPKKVPVVHRHQASAAADVRRPVSPAAPDRPSALARAVETVLENAARHDHSAVSGPSPRGRRDPSRPK